MASVVGVVLFVVVLLLHTLLAAITTRFFRLRLKTQWGYVVYTFLITPVVLLATSLVFFGVLRIDGGPRLSPPSRSPWRWGSPSTRSTCPHPRSTTCPTGPYVRSGRSYSSGAGT